VGEQLQRLAHAGHGAVLLGQRELEDPVAGERLAAQAAADQLDDLAGPAERVGVGQAVEALDHLRARGAEAQDGAAAADVVEPGRGLQECSRRAREDVEDGCADLDRLGLRGEVSHEGGGVEAVGLWHPDAVKAGILQGLDLVCCLPGIAGVEECAGELHELPS
jgi:hypothetical protein